nr:MAG TPA: hypothetical protein [Caudoviricetes sp.]
MNLVQLILVIVACNMATKGHDGWGWLIMCAILLGK